MESLKKAFFLIVGVGIVVWSFYAFWNKPAPSHYQESADLEEPSKRIRVIVGDKTISAEVANTDQERAQGLSGRESLGAETGLIFVFDTPGKYGFWMKNMKFPIDIVWIDETLQVVGVERLINPDTYPAQFFPPSDIKYALELTAGEASILGIDTGSILIFDARN